MTELRVLTFGDIDRLVGLMDELDRVYALDTSATPDEWSPAYRSRGHCAIVALVVQDLFGGDLMRTEVHGESHYLNCINGQLVDLTSQQFDDYVHDFPPDIRTREYVLSYPATVARYERLKERLP